MITSPTCPENSKVAIGRPVARLFFDPQKTMVISSACEKPSRLLAKVRMVITVASSATSTSATLNSFTRIDLMPDTVHDAVAESRVDDEQDRAVIHALERA